jgi:hypothetical protein
MPITNLNEVVSASEIDPAITTDTELTASIATAIAKTLSLFPRSATASVNGDNCLTTAAAGFMWVDGSTPHTNLPANTGFLVQGDPHWGSALAGLYRVQVMVPLTTVASGTVVYVRHQNNGNWAAWRIL